MGMRSTHDIFGGSFESTDGPVWETKTYYAPEMESSYVMHYEMNFFKRDLNDKLAQNWKIVNGSFKFEGNQYFISLERPKKN